MPVGSRRRRVAGAAMALLLSAALSAGVVPVGAEAQADERTGRRRQMLALTNEDRHERHRSELGFARRLSRYAKRHSRAMAEKGDIFHSSEQRLRRALDGYRWSIGGENVGVGGSLPSLERAFMASKLHRDNILRRQFRNAAIGVVRDGDRFWVTVIFYG